MESMEKLRVLITGASGFIGANFCHFFVSQGAEVHVLVRKTSNLWRIKSIKNKLDVHYCDLNEREKLKGLISEIKPEGIMHFAIYGGYPFQKETLQIIKTNFLGTVNLLDACMNVGFKWFINTGSSSEYGIKSKPMKEDDLLEPINDYGVAKAAGTLYCQSVAKRTEAPIYTMRLFSPYGYYEEPTRLVPYVIRSCLKNEALLLSNPNAVRDFVFIEDVINAYLQLILNMHLVKSGEIFNVGSGNQHKVSEVVAIIKKLTNSNSQLNWKRHLGRDSDILKIWEANIDKITSNLNWHSQYTLEEGLKKTIDWFKEHLNLYS
jgi:nucleoside-diphosphate-sugar epimerase